MIFGSGMSNAAGKYRRPCRLRRKKTGLGKFPGIGILTNLPFFLADFPGTVMMIGSFLSSDPRFPGCHGSREAGTGSCPTPVPGTQAPTDRRPYPLGGHVPT